MTTIGLTYSASLARALRGRGVEVVTGDDPDDVLGSATAVTSALRAGDRVDAVLVSAPDEASAGMLAAWARSLSGAAAGTRFLGLGACGGVEGVAEAPGGSLAELLQVLGVAPAPGDETVSVSPEGQVDPAAATVSNDLVEAAGGVSVGGPGAGVLMQTEPGLPARGSAPEPGMSAPTPPEEDAWGEGPEEGCLWGEIGSRPVSSPAAPGGLPAQPGVVAAPWGVVAGRGGPSATVSADWGNVLFLVSARGGVGQTSLAVNIAEGAAGRYGRKVVLVDASGGLATTLRVVRGGESSPLPSVEDLDAGSSVEHVVSGPEDVRRAGGTAVSFASVFAPEPDRVAQSAFSPESYLRVVDHLAPLSDLVVVDTPVLREKDLFATRLLAPGLRAGASVVIVSDASLEGVEGARRLGPWAVRLAPGRVTGALSIMPMSALPDEAAAARLLGPAPCLVTIPYDESVRLRAARGQVVHRLLGTAAERILGHIGVA